METSKLPAKKRNYEAVSSDDPPSEQEVAAMSRSERKRHREKKRRSDVNKGFDELLSLLLDIDPEVRADAEERASQGQCKKTLGSHEDNVLSRVDLITTAVRVLRRVHGENEKHKKMLEELLAKTGNGAPPAPASASLVESERYSHTAKGLGAASGLDSRFLRGTGAAPSPSWAERQALLSNPSAYAGLVGGPSHAWASRFSQFSHLAGYQAADLFSTRAAAGLPSADRAYLSQFGGASSANRGYIESLLQQKQSTDNRAMAEALYSSFQQRPTEKSDAPGKK